jgi:hypothetical protein
MDRLLPLPKLPSPYRRAGVAYAAASAPAAGRPSPTKATAGRTSCTYISAPSTIRRPSSRPARPSPTRNYPGCTSARPPASTGEGPLGRYRRGGRGPQLARVCRFIRSFLPGRDVDAYGFSRVVVERHEEGHHILEGGIANEAVEHGRLGQGLAVFEKSLDMQGQGFGGQALSFIEGSARGDATREIGKTDAVIGLTGFVQIGDVMHGDQLSYRNTMDHASMISTTIRSRRQAGARYCTFPGM